MKGWVTFHNITDNHDTKKKLWASITDVVEHYTEAFRHQWIHITGDTLVKTRLYRMHISNNLEEIKDAGYILLELKIGQARNL
ncbi:DUF6934 family protein [Segetibacter sp. 3557_3]|uniref:DUF6934 family protein n=1 Tax=Segetibacter sp. 3557_3 TaxID=2547429 RepID=UPI00397BA840